MSLSSIDILKSSLMNGLSDEDRKSFKGNWDNIDARLKNNDLSMDNLFTVYLYSKIVKNPKAILHKELLGAVKDEKALDVIHNIDNFSLAFIDLMTSKDKNIYCLKYLRHSIYWQSILTLAIYKKYENLEELKQILVAYYYQNWISGGTTSRIKQTSFNIIKILKENGSTDSLKKEILSNIEKFNTKSQFKEELSSSYVYGKKWDKALLLLMEYFSKDDSNQSYIPLDKKTWIEHILPQNPKDKSWNNFSGKQKRLWTNSLPNLTLLSMRKNIQAGNKSFEHKKKVYIKSDNVTTSFELTRRVFIKKDWNEETLKSRQKNLEQIIKKHIDIF